MGTIEIVNTGQMAVNVHAQGDTRPHVLEPGQKRIVGSIGSLRVEITALPERRGTNPDLGRLELDKCDLARD